MRLRTGIELWESLSPEQRQRINDDSAFMERDSNRVLVDYKGFRALASLARPNIRSRMLLAHEKLVERGYARSRYSSRAIEEHLQALRADHVVGYRHLPPVSLSVAVLKRELSKAKLTMLQVSKQQEIAKLFSNPDAMAGFSGTATGRKYKKDYTEEELHHEASEAVRLAHEHGTFMELIIPRYRTQAKMPINEEWEVQEDDFSDGKYDKTRLVDVIGMKQLLGEMHFSIPAQKYFEKIYQYAGGKDDAMLHRLISDCRQRFERWLSIDMSRYDESLGEEIIRLAFDVLRSMFVDEDFDEALFCTVMYDFIHANFLWKGKVVHVDNGVKSGSMLTSIINSICNLIVVGAFMIEQGITNYRAFVMGDDNLIFYTGDISLETLSEYYSRVFGLTVHPDKCTYGTRDDDPEYLSRIWRRDGVYRNPTELFIKISFPERWRDYKNNRVSTDAILWSYIQSFPLGMQEIMGFDRMHRWLTAHRHVETFMMDVKYVTGLGKVRTFVGQVDSRTFDDFTYPELLRGWPVAA